MFGNKNVANPTNSMSSSNNKNEVRSLNTISKGTVLVGDINAEGDLRIEGKVIGTLVCNSKLIVSSTGLCRRPRRCTKRYGRRRN